MLPPSWDILDVQQSMLLRILLGALFLAVIAGLWFWRKRSVQSEPEPDSIVILLKESRALNAHILAELSAK
jgi:hypothetical protein